MKIFGTTAMRIVREIESVINHDLTFMDTTAHIIACTNESRIGDFHGAAQKMLDEGLSILNVTTDDEYVGTRKGVNTTINIESQVVAIVGITGDFETVEKFVKIIKHMTEILLLEEIHKDQKLRLKNIHDRYIYEWIFSNNDWMTKDFYFQGLTLDIDITVPRRVILLTLDNRGVSAQPGDMDDHWEKVESAVKALFRGDKRVLWIINGYKLVLLVPEAKDDAIRETVFQLQERMTNPPIVLLFGADSLPTYSEGTHAGYLRAEKALLSNRNGRYGGIVFYNDIDVEIFLQEISNDTKREFVEKIFKGYTQQEIAHWCHILSELYCCNGSLSQASQRLFLHKNTLQYQLNKLKQNSGYDPRDLGDSSLFYIAIKIWNSINF